MKRSEYVKYVESHHYSRGKKPLVSGESITDPTYARTGRQLIFQPLNIEYRMKYPNGNPLNPDNPHDFPEYDKIYPDTFEAMRQAKAQVSNTKQKLDDIHKKSQQPKQEPKPQPQTT